ncbi:2-C-methyl-D-erythritol 4-phosphate cytidylyltransferase [Nocardioides sp. BE266]|uniref:2-C-methyl-D-erythritol 4-phosphate cytidylyltransferase n=1 Tax=Nocardioides sp. BE266 TaxID=2817725 RepID=UPI0028593090|nr:2-C-methyl-D-erythritol 4-phosphate cytidylyltransferase [Nocardioides sp. BE266]MDR7255542.1 2-C-methyl-D-erythritol 4-phosphate cytidylyltransferase [Nocardioides sp. BE266]
MSAAMPGVLAMAGRDGLPFASLHKAPLYLHALRSLAASGAAELVVAVDVADLDRVVREVRHAGLDAEVRAGSGWWDDLQARDTSAGLLVHDALCPLASADFLRSVRTGADRPDASVLAYRPVTDTVKTVVDSRIQGTIDREGLAALVSPAVIAPDVLAAAVAADERPPVDDFARLAGWLRDRGRVELVRAPSLARRVDDASSVNLLECVDELARRTRREPVSDAAGPGTR